MGESMKTIIEVFRVLGRAFKDFWDELYLLALLNLATLVPILLLFGLLYGAFSLLQAGKQTLAIILGALVPGALILFPPALAGLWNVANKVTDGFAAYWKDYVEGFRKYFWKSLVLALINVVVIIVSVVSIQFYALNNNPLNLGPLISTILQGFSTAILLIWLPMQMYPLALLFQQSDQRLTTTYRNAGVLFLTRPGFTILLALLLLLLIAISVVIQIPVILITFSLVAVICTKAVKHLLEPFLEQEEDASTDEDEEKAAADE